MGHFCYCIFKVSLCKVLFVNALQNLRAWKILFCMICFLLMHCVLHAGELQVWHISESDFNHLSDSFYLLLLFRFREAEDKSAIFGSQKPHRADNMLHNTKSTAQISQQLRTASFLSSSRTDRERWCVCVKEKEQTKIQG